jgi:ubiquinone/menaquinone biosynthesis C-methylase UbiE
MQQNDVSKITSNRYWHLVYALEALAGVKGKLLDVGCGKGMITSQMKKRRPDLEVGAVDESQEQLNDFIKYYLGDGGVKLFRGEAQKLGVKDKQFEAVVMFDVLEHLEKPEAAIEEISRIIVPGGVFHLVVPLEGELTSIDGWIKKLWGKNLKRVTIGHVQQFTLKEIKGMLNESGWQVNKIRYSYHLGYQWLSLGYFLLVALVNRGEYLPLESKHQVINRLIEMLKTGSMRVINLESKLLARVRGQTAHITSLYIGK